MIDFTSSLYLGFWHAGRSLRLWRQMTTGVPAALAEPPGLPAAAERLAALQGCESGVLASSTLHLFWDLFSQLARERVSVYMDAGAYPVARWGVERAAAGGTPAVSFMHRDPHALHLLLKKHTAGRRPVVVTNGVCVCCGMPAPLEEYLALVGPADGLLVVDDTQALGVFGEHPGPGAPYGKGGGGTLRRLGLVGGHKGGGRHRSGGGARNGGGHGNGEIILISSLAKGFGVPAALLSGSREEVRRFTQHSQTRVHCSPPSIVEVHALENALSRNERMGDVLRWILAQRVMMFRRALEAIGCQTQGGLFPVQTLVAPAPLDDARLYHALLERGIHCVPQRGRHAKGVQLSFILTARTLPKEIEQTAWVLKGLIHGSKAARRQKIKEFRDVTIPSVGSLAGTR